MTAYKRIVAALLIGSTVAAHGATKSIVADIHKRAITPSSDVLFAAESKNPANDADWNILVTNAETLAKAAQQLPPTRRDAKWERLTLKLAKAAQAAASAARSRNLDAIVAANGNIVATCEACHDDFRDAGHGMTSDQAAGARKPN